MSLGKIIQGDALEELKKLPDESVDLVLTDPPYGINYHSNRYRKSNPFNKIKNDNCLFLPLEELWRIVKPTGAILSFYSHKKPLIDGRIKNILIWAKNNWSAGDLYGDFANQYEPIVFIPKDEFKLSHRRCSNLLLFNRVPSHKLLHPTEKPLELIKELVEVTTKKGDIIIDPFLGSGTTGLACEMLGRRWIGIEIDPDYCKIAEKRLSEWKGQTRL